MVIASMVLASYNLLLKCREWINAVDENENMNFSYLDDAMQYKLEANIQREHLHVQRGGKELYRSWVKLAL